MYKVLLGLGTISQFDLSNEEQIRLFKQIGYEAFFVNWSKEMDLESIARTAKEEKMIFQSIHAPFTKAADMWTDTPKAQEAVDELIDCLRDCAAYKVPIMVAHAFIGFEDHSPNEWGIINYGKVIEEAKRLSVKIAFENTEGEEYLDALMEAFREYDNVGFCWDTGHEMCYNYSRDMTARYGDRLFCTHLNDNLGIRDYEGKITWIDDLHLLPFDGIADWKSITSRLNCHGYEDVLMFELGIRNKPGRYENASYSKMEIVEYLTESYKRACRVAALKVFGQGGVFGFQQIR